MRTILNQLSYRNLSRKVAALVAATLLVGCSSDSPDTPGTAGTDAPMRLAAQPASDASEASRAPSPLENVYNDFGAWAWKTMPDGSVQMVLSRATTAAHGTAYYTRWTGNAWSYEYTSAPDIVQYLRYWDRGAASYLFAAYAPYMLGTEPATASHTISASAAGVSISDVAGNSPDAVDWVEARWQRDNTLSPVLDTDLFNDNTYPMAEGLTATVPLVFHHILSQVVFRLYNAEEETVRVTSASITLADGATISTLADYTHGSWSYHPGATSSTLYDASGLTLDVTGPDRAHSVVLGQRVEIPQDVATKYVNVSITIEGNAEPLTGTFPLAEGWDPEKKYVYYIRISAKRQIILVELDIESFRWKPGSDINLEDPLTNW